MWRRAIKALLIKAAKDGFLEAPGDPDGQASLVVAAVMGACMIPVWQQLALEVSAELQRSI